MKNKKILFLSVFASFAAYGALFAADQLGQYSDAVKNVNGSRWQLFRGASTANVAAATLNFTNVVSSTAGIVGKIVWVPGNAGDTLSIHTASSATGATAANEIFVVNSTTNSTAGAPTGYPQIFDFSANGSGVLNATNGIVAVVKPANTSVVSRVFIQFDQNR